MNATGWAVIFQGQIDVESISTTRSDALRRWLSDSTTFLPHGNARWSVSDVEIEAEWQRAVKLYKDVRVTEVNIEARRP